jgi:glucose-1-phosphate cytidylyltransferase
MKVVLFCGGLGTRLREHSDVLPKSLVDIGSRPIIWHLMRYYAHYGHKDFILCLGYKAEMIKEYFLNYNSYAHRDFVMYEGGRRISPSESDIADWTIRFVDTGLHANIGERLMAVRSHVEDEEVFLANYTDQLSDFHLPDIISFHKKQKMIASFLSVRPSQSFHQLEVADNGQVVKFGPASAGDNWINGGFMVLNREVFDYMEEGEEFVEEPFARLMEIGKLGSVKCPGFWAAMDTFKDKITYDRMNGRGDRPWEVWNDNS